MEKIGSDKVFGSLLYSDGKGEGVVAIEPSFLEEHHVAQLDVLQDWIACLNSMYEQALSELGEVSTTPKGEGGGNPGCRTAS